MTHIGQGGMVDDWWQSAPGKIAEPLILSWETGTKKCGDLCELGIWDNGIYTVHGRVVVITELGGGILNFSYILAHLKVRSNEYLTS